MNPTSYTQELNDMREPFSKEAPLDIRSLFDVTASDRVLYEQLFAFFREGHTGSELTTLISYNHKPGIAAHVTRLLTILKEGTLFS